MPTISMFFGMVVQMYWLDHAPPHFHVHYQGFEAAFSIETGELTDGRMPRTARRLVRDWALRHRDELMENWERGRKRRPFRAIEGADYED